jgi:UDP-3-O-[3-hydroxymyristoyl] glucosamine N-acyltransferase
VTKVKIRASEIAEFLGLKLIGKDIVITCVASLDDVRENALMFRTRLVPSFLSVDKPLQSLLLTSVEPDTGSVSSIILSKNPRLDFARVVQRFFAQPISRGVHETAIAHPDSDVSSSSSIGAYCIIEEGVVIMPDVVIEEFSIIRKNTIIDVGTRIKSHTSIGNDGFGFEFDDDGTPIRLQHLGGVKIGKNVEIGSHVVIARGTINDTQIGDNVKIDDQVFIAHNVKIGENTVIIAGSEISGSVEIGKNCWISPQVTILNKIKIGDNSLVGIGSVVTLDIQDNKVVVGNPARVLRDRNL